jgi:hypothetical protein
MQRAPAAGGAAPPGPDDDLTPYELARVDQTPPAERQVGAPASPGTRPEIASARTLRHQERRGLRWVSAGLGFHYWELVFFLGGVALTAAVLISGVFGLGWPAPVPLILTLAATLTRLAAPLLGVVGAVLCLSVPVQSRARPFMAVSLILKLGLPVTPLFLLYIYFLYDGWYAGKLALVLLVGDPSREVAAWLFFLLLLGRLAAWLSFLLFLGRVAGYLEEPVAADEAVQLIWAAVRGLGVLVLLVLVAVALVRFCGSLLGFMWLRLMLILGSLAFVAWIIFAIRYVFRVMDLIATLRQVIVSHG